MPTLNELLAYTLHGMPETYTQTVADLQALVEELTTAIRQQAGLINSTLRLSRVHENARSTIYKLTLEFDPAHGEPEPALIDFFRIPAQGYPIIEGYYTKRPTRFTPGKELANRDELHAYAADLITHPNSALLQAIAFGMRKAKEAAAQATNENQVEQE